MMFFPRFRGLVCIITNHNRQLLLLKRAANKTIFPNKWAVVAAGPYILPWTDMKKKAIAEVKDEVGFVPPDITLIKTVITQIKGSSWQVSIFTTQAPDNIEIVLNREHTEYRWITLAQLELYDTAPKMKDLLETLVM